jgi:hypothetical protein
MRSKPTHKIIEITVAISFVDFYSKLLKDKIGNVQMIR